MIFRSFAYFSGIYLFIFGILEKENHFQLVGRLLAQGHSAVWAGGPLWRLDSPTRWPIWRPNPTVAMAQQCKARGTHGRGGAQSLWSWPARQWSSQWRAGRWGAAVGAARARVRRGEHVGQGGGGRLSPEKAGNGRVQRCDRCGGVLRQRELPGGQRRLRQVP
jgi:hypothetical protein